MQNRDIYASSKFDLQLLRGEVTITSSRLLLQVEGTGICVNWWTSQRPVKSPDSIGVRVWWERISFQK